MFRKESSLPRIVQPVKTFRLFRPDPFPEGAAKAPPFPQAPHAPCRIPGLPDIFFYV